VKYIFFIPAFFAVYFSLTATNILNRSSYRGSGTFWKVCRKNTKLTITTENTILVLDEAKAFAVESLSDPASRKNNTISRIFLAAKEKGEKDIYEYLNIKKDDISCLNISESNGILKIEIIENWPAFVCRKIIEFYKGEPFFRIKFDLLFTKNRVYSEIWCSISTSPDAGFMISGCNEGTLRMERNSSGKDIWSEFKRFPQNRWFGFYYEKFGEGLAVMSPDPKSWMEIDKSFVCSQAQGGFSLGPGKCREKELRAGESISFDFFIMPVKCKFTEFEGKTIRAYKNFFPGGEDL